jgi:hypothetical protein
MAHREQGRRRAVGVALMPAFYELRLFPFDYDVANASEAVQIGYGYGNVAQPVTAVLDNL